MIDRSNSGAPRGRRSDTSAAYTTAEVAAKTYGDAYYQKWLAVNPHRSGDHTEDDRLNRLISKALWDAKMVGIGDPEGATFHVGTATFLVKKFGSLDYAIKFVMDSMKAFAKEQGIEATYYSTQVLTHGQFENWMKARAGSDAPPPVQVPGQAKFDAQPRKVEVAAPASSSEPTDDWGAQFRAKWARATKEEFEAAYGVKYGEHIPPMAAFDEREAIFRARCSYPTYGIRYMVDDAVADAAIEVISRATEATAGGLKETGLGLTDADVCAYGYRVGTFPGPPTPWDYRGKTLEEFLAPNFGGTASGG